MLYRISGVNEYGVRICVELCYTLDDARRIADLAAPYLQLLTLDILRKPRKQEKV